MSTEHFHLGKLHLQRLVLLTVCNLHVGQQRRKQTSDLLNPPTYFHSHTCDTPTQLLQLTTGSRCFNPSFALSPKVLTRPYLHFYSTSVWCLPLLVHYVKRKRRKNEKCYLQQSHRKSDKITVDAAFRVVLEKITIYGLNYSLSLLNVASVCAIYWFIWLFGV